MPTIKQLPAASAVNATDELPLSQGGITRSVQVSALLAGTQSAISLVKGRLLGRVSAVPGGPEPVSLGTGLILQGGALTPTGDDHAGFTAASDLQAGDEVIVNSANAPRRLPAIKLRGLFSAGTGVQIDTSGVISVTTGGAGLTGPKGDVGATGAVGAQGPKGDTGAAGATGPQGVKGDTGAVGSAGARGDSGNVGAAGPQGQTGLTGAPGAIGPAGIQGPIGQTGAAGAKGDTGNAGAAGPQGAIGLTGALGATGPAGIQGPIGQTGAAGVKGDTGNAGAAGPQGSIGLTGALGATGPAGIQGPIGQTGATGAKGDTGNAGAAGPQGPPGAPGSGIGYNPRGTWTASTAYAPGDVVTNAGSSYVATTTFTSGGSFSASNWTLQALAGATGNTGAQGAAGTVGAQGPAGVTGAVGAQGPIGNTGATGPVGAAGPGIASATVNSSNRLILTRTDSTTIDAGVLPSTARTVATTLTAAGTNQANAYALTADESIVSTVATGAGIILRAISGQRVLNRGANALLVYPPSGGTIEGAASVTLPAGAAAVFVTSDNVNFFGG